MHIEATLPRLTRPGDFAGELREDTVLRLPCVLEPLLTTYNIRTAADLVTYAHTYPGLIAAELGWSPDDVTTATIRLARQLEGKVHEAILYPQRPVRKGYGAQPPEVKRR